MGQNWNIDTSRISLSCSCLYEHTYHVVLAFTTNLRNDLITCLGQRKKHTIFLFQDPTHIKTGEIYMIQVGEQILARWLDRQSWLISWVVHQACKFPTFAIWTCYLPSHICKHGLSMLPHHLATTGAGCKYELVSYSCTLLQHLKALYANQKRIGQKL